MHFQTLPELSLYVHLPWCVRKCPYCDFNSHEHRGGQDLPEQDYIQALIADLEASLPLIWGRPVISIFMGGGTPSLFSERSIDQLLGAIRARVKLLPGAEITMEANPGTFEAERFAGYARAGVNRLSLGVQSFDSQKLTRLGRVHDSDQAMRAAAHAVQTFDRVNLDLMFGLPGQTLAQCLADLKQAIEFSTGHLSFYQLTIEPNTAFAVNPPAGHDALPPEELTDDMQAAAIELLSAHGLSRYEVSAFSRPDQRCQHNLNYWSFGDYLGIGAGAHSKLSFPNRIIRQARYRQPKAFMQAALGHRGGGQGGGQGECLEHEERGQPAVEIERQLSLSDLPFEFMLNALRLVEGVPVSRWAQTTGMTPGEHPLLLERLALAQKRGLLEAMPAHWRASPLGFRFLNDLQQIFLA